MTLELWGYESGINGAALDSVNTNGGTPIVVGGAATISTVNPVHGTRGARFAGSSTMGGCYEQHPMSTTVVLERFFFRFVGSLPSADTALAWLGNGSSQRAHIEVTALGQLRFRDDANAAQWISAGGQSTATIAADTTYRCVYYFDMTAGQARVAIYTGNSSSPISGLDTGLRTGLGLGADSYTTRRHGSKCTTSTTVATVDVDDVGVDDAPAGFSAFTYGQAPTIDAGVNQTVTAGATVTMAPTIADADGTIASIAWTWLQHPTAAVGSTTGITGASTAGASFTAGSAPGLYILQCLVTDNDGFTASDTVEVRVPATGSTTVTPIPANGTGTGTWTIGGGSANEGAALGDTNDATYVESPVLSASPATRRWRIQPAGAKSVAQLEVDVWTDTGVGHGVVRLYQGATLRQTWDLDTDSTPARSIQTLAAQPDPTFTCILSAPTIAALGSDWLDVFVEVEVTT